MYTQCIRSVYIPCTFFHQKFHCLDCLVWAEKKPLEDLIIVARFVKRNLRHFSKILRCVSIGVVAWFSLCAWYFISCSDSHLERCIEWWAAMHQETVDVRWAMTLYADTCSKCASEWRLLVSRNCETSSWPVPVRLTKLSSEPVPNSTEGGSGSIENSHL